MIIDQSIFVVLTDLATIISPLVAIAAMFVALYISYKDNLPNVILYLRYDKDKRAVYLVLRNFGKGVARNVKLVCDNLDDIVQEQFQLVGLPTFMTKGIQNLVPGDERASIIATGEVQRDMGDKSVLVDVSYTYKGFLPWTIKRCNEEFVIDYTSLYGQLSSDTELHLIRVAIQKLAKSK